MPRLNVEILGLRKLTKALRQYPKLSGKNVQKAINQSILKIEAKSKPITPIDTGFLRNSYRRAFKPLTGILKVTAEYALEVHERTFPQPRNPGTVRKFLEVGIEKSKRDISKFFKQALDKTIKNIALKSRF